MKKKLKKIKRRNAIAAHMLLNPLFRSKKIENKKRKHSKNFCRQKD